MKLKTACLAVALTAIVALPAHAGGYGVSVKDGGSYGTPVPAPIPIPDTFSWYIRGDVAIGTSTGSDVSDRGREYGVPSPCGDCFRADPTFGMSSSWFDAKYDNQFTGGFGIGRYLSPQFRMDFTVDFTTEGRVNGDGAFSYTEVDATGTPTGFDVDGNTRERIKIKDTVALLNAYYDIVPRGRLTPYVGFGLGIASRSIDREHYTREDRIDPATGGIVGQRDWNGNSRESRIAPAASATVGLAYAITPGLIVDLNYRYTYIGEVETKMDITSTDGIVQTSRMTIGDTHQHALRAGMRVNIW